MDFSFQEDFKKLSISCPPRHYKAFNKTVYRWVFDEIENEKNFKPRYYLVPIKELEKIQNIQDVKIRDTKTCSMLALSMFLSEKEAFDRFKDLEDDMGKKVYNFLGTNIAVGDITENDGVNGDYDDFGHFNHHPAMNGNYESKFKIFSSLKQWKN